MKKYVKPELFYEHFELSQHIADCTWELQLNKGSCSAQADPDFIVSSELLFSANVTTPASCTVSPDDGTYSDVCYHGGDVHANVFVS